jgi:hypothetical protein
LAKTGHASVIIEQMRTRIISAIVIAILLILFSLWSRLPKIDTSEGQLVKNTTDTKVTNILSNPIPLNLGTSTEIDLNNTEVVSRQMFSDYINLSASGNSTSEEIASIAGKYIDAIPVIKSGIHENLDITDIKTNANIKINFEKYELAVKQIHEKYGELIKTAYPGNDILSGYSSETYAYLGQMSAAYIDMANEILKVPAPLEISLKHLQLINNYLLTGKAMKILSSSASDPTTLVAAISAINDSINQQNDIINSINQILIKNTI